MRMRVASENQDESKRPLKRRRTRQGTLRKPSSTTKDTTRNHQSTRTTRPAFEEDTSLLKARDHDAWFHDSTATRDAARQEKDNNYGKRAKCIWVAREEHVYSLVS